MVFLNSINRLGITYLLQNCTFILHSYPSHTLSLSLPFPLFFSPTHSLMPSLSFPPPFLLFYYHTHSHPLSLFHPFPYSLSFSHSPSPFSFIFSHTHSYPLPLPLPFSLSSPVSLPFPLFSSLTHALAISLSLFFPFQSHCLHRSPPLLIRQIPDFPRFHLLICIWLFMIFGRLPPPFFTSLASPLLLHRISHTAAVISVVLLF